ncbi:MAG: hypothetical protein KHZ93_06770 [Clostridiales bacterium]|nr:hypothetical protein [Clostridiales bacterium]
MLKKKEKRPCECDKNEPLDADSFAIDTFHSCFVFSLLTRIEKFCHIPLVFYTRREKQEPQTTCFFIFISFFFHRKQAPHQAAPFSFVAKEFEKVPFPHKGNGRAFFGAKAATKRMIQLSAFFL